MSGPEIPFDVSYVMPDGLRARPNDPHAMAAAVAWLLVRAEEVDAGRERARLLGLAGAYAGILRQVDRAATLLREAIVLAERAGDGRLVVVQRIRLADVLAVGGDPQAAVSLLRPLLDRHSVHGSVRDGDAGGEADPDGLADFVHQHLGKALLEAGDPAGAVAHLEQALSLRTRKGDLDLIESSRAALATARQAGEERP